ncbi:unnamed protein product [Orchesella dallaii]|uniref:Uncharacterized protein n=1 Tax=Orchesella dallaii TaxID=48710 RepID=A0ABP1RUE7_9HEXA
METRNKADKSKLVHLEIRGQKLVAVSNSVSIAHKMEGRNNNRDEVRRTHDFGLRLNPPRSNPGPSSSAPPDTPLTSRQHLSNLTSTVGTSGSSRLPITAPQGPQNSALNLSDLDRLFPANSEGTPNTGNPPNQTQQPGGSICRPQPTSGLGATAT